MLHAYRQFKAYAQPRLTPRAPLCSPFLHPSSKVTAQCRCCRSRLLEFAACIPGSVRLSARKRAREGIESGPVLRPTRGTASRTSASDREVRAVQRQIVSHTALQPARPHAPSLRHPNIFRPCRHIGTAASQCGDSKLSSSSRASWRAHRWISNPGSRLKTESTRGARST